MKVKIKKVNPEIETVIPKYAKDGDAGLDLVATSKEYDDNGNVVYGTNLAIEIPKGYVGFIFPRSSISKYDLSLANAVGIIDSGYRGEIKFKFKPTLSISDAELEKVFDYESTYEYIEMSNTSYFLGKEYNVGDRIGQLIIMPYPEIELELVDELSETERGNGGFGSTDK